MVRKLILALALVATLAYAAMHLAVTKLWQKYRSGLVIRWQRISIGLQGTAVALNLGLAFR